MYRDLTKRIVALALSVCMIAGMVDLSGLTVRAAERPIENAVITVDISTPIVYDGSPKKPAVTVVDSKGNTLTARPEGASSGGDYILEYKDNINRGLATVTITNVNDSTDTVDQTFFIQAKDIGDCDGLPQSADLSSRIPQDGAEATPAITVTDGGRTLAEGTDYTYSFSNNTHEGEGTVTITGRGNYQGSQDVTFTISLLDGSLLNYKLTDGKYEYTDGYVPYNNGEQIELFAEDISYEADSIREDQCEVRYGSNRSFAGEMEAWIEVVSGEYRGLVSDHKKFTIRKRLDRDYGGRKVSVAYIVASKPYNGGRDVVLTEEDIRVVDPDYSNTPLKLGEDYTINYQDAKNVGTATIQIVGNGKQYQGNINDVHFEITTTDLVASMVKPYGEDGTAKYVYDINADGTDKNLFSEVEANLVVSNGDIKYVKSTDNGRTGDYTVRADTSPTSAGTHYVIVTATSNGQLTAGQTVRIPYTVEPRSLTDPGITLETANYSGTDMIYNGQPKSPGLRITYKSESSGGEKVLAAGTDYERNLRYTGDLTNATAEGKQAYVGATGRGNFTGESDMLPFEIKPIEMIDKAADPTGGNITIGGIAPEYIYTGAAIVPPGLSVTHTARGTLTVNRDYTVECVSNTDVGTATVTIKGMGNYKGEFTRQFQITPRSLRELNVRVDQPTMQYTGEQLTPTVTVTHNGRTLVMNTDYTLDYGPNIEVGQGTVTLTGIGNYKDTTDPKTFTISQRNITAGTLKVRDMDKGYELDVAAAGKADECRYSYTGSAITLNLTVSYENAEAGMGSKDLTADDYDLEYSNNTAIGTATVTVKAKGNYIGNKPVVFTIKGDLSDGNFTKVEIPEQVYTSNPIVPADATVTFDGKTLIFGTDFDVVCEYGDNTNAGLATATIRGKGNYFNAAENQQFTIRRFDLSKDDLEEKEFVIGNIAESYPFIEVGHSIQPQPQITHNGNPVNSDYMTEYGDNNKVGSGTVVITGLGVNYENSRTKTFEIVPYDLGADYATGHIDVQGVADVILDAVIEGTDTNAQITDDGQVVMSDLKVMYTPVALDGTELTARALDLDTECDIIYKDNKKIGTATITINGKGNFGGTITRTFRIRGDLSSDRTSVSVEDCDYSPAGNTPVPAVTYTYDNGTEEILEAGTDYTVEYADNTDATAKSGLKGKVVIHPAVVDGVTGDYGQSGTEARAAEFEIRQRDLSKAVGEEGEKDPALSVTGLLEEGYEYTGLDIVPELQIACDNLNLSVGEDGDYSIAAENNRNVYTFEEENGVRGERLMPTVIVSAAKDADGNYTGNYKNGFQMEFKINPRLISKEEGTVSTILRVNGEEYGDEEVPEVDFTGRPITFYKYPDDPADTTTDMEVTWSRQGQNTTLIENQDYSVEYRDNTGIGEASIHISAAEFSNYAGEYDRIFKIMASIEVVDEENPPLKYMTLEYDHNVPFGIVDVYPEMIFEDISAGRNQPPYILEEGKDFIIVKESDSPTDKGVSINNRDVASENLPEEERPTVVIQGIGCYRGTIKRYYNIIPKNLTTDEGDITIVFEGALNSEEYENAYIFNGSAIEPTVTVYNHGQVMQPGQDYEVAGYVNNTAISTEARRAGVIIRAVDGGNYVGQKTFYFDIIPRSIDGMQVELVNGNPVYNRSKQEPEVEVSFVEDGEKVILTKNDYDAVYENNVEVATEFAGENAPVVIVTGKGSYGGEVRKTFTIEPEPLDEPLEGGYDDFDITAASRPYTGMTVTTEVTVKAKDGTLLEEEKDYRITGYRDNVSAGTGFVTIEGIGSYTGSRDVPFNIIPPDVSRDFRVSEIPVQTYTGRPIEPQVDVWLEVEGEEIPLTPSDYTFEYENNTNAGTAVLIVRGAGNFGGELRVDFTIAPKKISRDVSGDDGTVSGDDGLAADMTLEPIEDQLYTGKGITPDITLRFHSPLREMDDMGELLELGKDYTLSYLTNVPVGRASVIITGIGNYTGSVQTNFRILGPLDLAEISKIEAQPYTGNPVTPKPTITLAGKTLTENEDYTLEYANNTAQGTATIIITGVGWYTGKREVNFEIARDFSDSTVVKGIASAYTYTGKAITPVVLVEDHGRILSRGTDYEVSYIGNVNVGTATVTVTGMGRYNGSVSAQFKIMPQNIGRATASQIADQTYDGKSKTPSVVVQSDGITLRQGADYAVSYVDNKSPGKASVVIKGTGNYTGTKTVNYSIVVPKVTGVKVSGYTDTSITFSWKRNKAVSGYEIYSSKNKRLAFVKKNSITKATVAKLKAGSKGTYRVRAFVGKDKYYYSDFVTIKAGTAPKETNITSITSKKSKQVALKWKKVKGATKYQVYRGTKLNGKYKRIATTGKTSYTDKKATKGKTYFYKIRVCRKVGSKTYYSDYSSVKFVAAKK